MRKPALVVHASKIEKAAEFPSISRSQRCQILAAWPGIDAGVRSQYTRHSIWLYLCLLRRARESVSAADLANNDISLVRTRRKETDKKRGKEASYGPTLRSIRKIPR